MIIPATHADAVILAATVGAMIAINREWLFTWKPGLDSSMYIGYFLHYDSPDFLAYNKKIARLPRLAEKLLGRQPAILATLTYLTSQSMHGGKVIMRQRLSRGRTTTATPRLSQRRCSGRPCESGGIMSLAGR